MKHQYNIQRSNQPLTEQMFWKKYPKQPLPKIRKNWKKLAAQCNHNNIISAFNRTVKGTEKSTTTKQQEGIHTTNDINNSYDATNVT